MVYRKKKVGRKTRRNGPLSKGQVKAIARIAKKVDFRNDETKVIQSPASGLNIGVNSSSGALGTWNLTNRFVAGLGGQQMIGRSVHIQNLLIKYALHREPGPTDTEMNPAICRVLLLWADAENATSSIKADFFLTDTYNAAGAQGQSRGIVDPKKARVLYDRTHVLTPYAVNQQNVVFASINKKIDRTLTFKSDPLTLTTGSFPTQSKGNLYFITVPENMNGWTVSQTPTIGGEMRFYMTYKDA